jgi:O-antigen/teichoic acid export membrane protein
MAGAMVIAGGFDALVSILSGRWLGKEQFAVFVAVTAILQIAVHLTNVIRNVTAYYTAELTVLPESTSAIRTFLRRSWRWAWRWGLLATAAALLLSPFIARFMKMESAWPLYAASLALLMLFVRPVTDGTLQGIQHFIGLGTVQVLQSVLRLAFAAVLIMAGLQAFGAMLSLPLATTAAMLAAVWFLRSYFRKPMKEVPVPSVSLRYSAYTLAGLLSFALLVNVDAIVVKRFFSDIVAGDYGTVVTLGKINLFATLGIGMVLFPKATQRHSAGRDPRPVLVLALVATFLVGAFLTAAYFLASGLIVQTIFSDIYADPGIVLGLVGVATTLYAGISIWLNYALSLDRHAFVIALAVLVVLVILAMGLYHDSLVTIASIMIVAGIAGNLAGAVTTLPGRRSTA